MASGSLPPGFPALEIEGEYYRDGGLISNTPLQRVVDYGPRQDTLAFQVDLWSARGGFPGNLLRSRCGLDPFRVAVRLLRSPASAI
jgi:NTE family protein